MKNAPIKLVFISLLALVLTDLYAEISSKAYPTYFPKPVKYSEWQSAQAQDMKTPNFLSAIRDPDTGYQTWRLGGSAEEMGNSVKHPNGNGSITLTHAQHYYSQTNPANLNETFAIGSAGRSKAFAALWRLKDKKLVAWVPSPNPETNIAQRQLLWDKNNYNVYWYAEANKLIRVELNLENYFAKSKIWDIFPKYESITFGLGSGDFSDDGSKIVLVGKQTSEKLSNDKVILSYLVDTKEIIAEKKIKEKDGDVLDWAGVDPTGEYIVFNDPSKSETTWVLPFNLKGIPRILYKHIKHSDFVVDGSGNAWIVFGNWQGVFASKLANPELKRVWPKLDIVDSEKYDGSQVSLPSGESASGHISRVSSVKGLVLLSRNEDGGLYFINIDQPGDSLYVGNTRHGKRPVNHPLSKADWGVDSNGEVVSSDGGKDYYREPRASASSSGKFLFFVSDYHIYGTKYASDPNPVAYLNLIELN